MTEKERIQKNTTIKETLKKTRERHSSMRPLVVEMKLDLKCLNKSERNNLFLYSFRSFFSNSSHTLKGVNFLAGCFVKPAGQHCADWGYNKHRYITIRGIVSVRRVNFGNA